MTEDSGAKSNVWMRAAMGGRLGSRLSGLGLDEGASLPSRLQGLSELPWFECWVQRLKTEKKSVHTIRAYTVAARTLRRHLCQAKRLSTGSRLSHSVY